MKKGTTNAAPESKGKGTKKNVKISIETAKIIHLLFGTPLEKIPIKMEAENEN